MPFQIVTEMPPPTVNVFFHGLLVLRASGDGTACSADILYGAEPAHTLSVEVRVKRPGHADLITMRHFGPLDGEHPGLTVRGPRPGALVTKLQPEDEFDPAASNGGHESDFRWIINPAGRLFHGGRLIVDESGTRPGVVLSDGDFCFHTAARLVGPIGVTQGGVVKHRMAAMASVVGAGLRMGEGDEVVLTWVEGGAEREYRLERPELPDTTYEIYVDNSPLYDDQSGGPSHSEMAQYYRALRDASGGEIPEHARFSLEFSDLPSAKRRSAGAGPHRASVKFDLKCCPRIPCGSVVLEP